MYEFAIRCFTQESTWLIKANNYICTPHYRQFITNYSLIFIDTNISTRYYGEFNMGYN